MVMKFLSALVVTAIPALCAAQSPNTSPGGTGTIGVPPAVPNTSASGAVPAAPTYRTGMGTVDSVSLVHLTSPPAASAGASAPVRPAYRLSVRMDDGTVQSLDQDNRNFMVGDRVEVTSGGQIVRRR
jgi:hypothetical protein